MRCCDEPYYLVAVDRVERYVAAAFLTIAVSGGRVEKIFKRKSAYTATVDDGMLQISYTVASGIKAKSGSDVVDVTMDTVLGPERFSSALSVSSGSFRSHEDFDLSQQRCTSNGIVVVTSVGLLGSDGEMTKSVWDMENDVSCNARSCGVTVAWVPAALSAMVQGVLSGRPLCIWSVNLDGNAERSAGETQEAFHKILVSYIAGHIASDSECSSIRCCMYACLRETSSSSPWTIRSREEMRILTSSQTPLSRLLWSPEPRDFLLFAEILGLAYRGPGLQTNALDGNRVFQNTPTCLPQMPWGSPVLERPTEWPYACTDSSGDVIEAQYQVFLQASSLY